MTVYPNSAGLYFANLIRTALAAGMVHLYTAIANPISPSSVIGDFTEADYSGYAALEVTTWLAAYLDPAGGGSIQNGTQQFQYVFTSGTPVPNTILGFYLTNAAGALVMCGNFAAPVSMAANGDAIPLNLTLNFGAN